MDNCNIFDQILFKDKELNNHKNNISIGYKYFTNQILILIKHDISK